LIDDHTAVEIKSGAVSIADTRGLNAIAEEMPAINKWIVTRDSQLRKLSGGSIVMPWQQFIARLAEGNFQR
jgi:hypothetical protein